MISDRSRRLFLLAGLAGAVVLALLGEAAWQAWRSTARYQFTEARRRWEARPFLNYRLAANAEHKRAQCHYDVEVRNERVTHVFAVSCIGSAQIQTLTVEGLFQVFEGYVTDRVCSPNGCYCEGTYVLRATYDAVWGYPRRITTQFRRYWLDDVLHGKRGVYECLRITPVVEKFDVVTLTPLP